MRISVIIPTFNEAENIGNLVQHLLKNSDQSLCEIIISDGGSTDDTTLTTLKMPVKTVSSPTKGRARQMNFGASLAKGEVLYFVHADTLPPKTYLKDILKAVEKGYEIGRYLSRYKSKSRLLKINAFLSRFDTFAGMGGDQTLFITKSLFYKNGGFNGEMRIMEEFEFCARARKNVRYKIIPKSVLISARKYETNGWLKVQVANYTVVKMYGRGATQDEMVSKYKQLLKYR